MRLRSITPFIIIALAVAIASVPPVAAQSYTLSISPTAPVSLGSTINLALSLTGGARRSSYTITFDVVKPNGTGSALTSRVISTDNTGAGSISLSYPDPSWTAVNGTVLTDVGGVYNVFANQTSPVNVGTVASGQFTVSSQLTVVVSQPAAGTLVQRGQTATISVTVSSLNGPDTGATVSANTPSGGSVFLPQTGIGVYTVSYLVSASDPIGPWTIIVRASDSQGNTGSSSPVTITITKNDLIVDSLVTYNSKGPTTSFSPGDTIYAFFRIQYASGSYLSSGQYAVGLKNPSGTLVANLTAAYDASLFGFYTSTGYPVSSFDPGGTWTVLIYANSINDGYGNTGPDLSTSVPIQIVTSPLSYWPFVLAGLIAIAGVVVTAKRFDTTLEGFPHLEQIMGGPLPRGASLLLSGDAGSGKTILAYQILHDELESGKICALLSYDAFPEDVQARMNEFGWDIVSPLRKGRLKIIDCYSSLAGQGEGAIKDPSDLTELNIQVTAFIGKAKGGPVTLVLDSLTPIFNGVEEKQAINFIQTLAAKVKKTGGLFIQTASKGAVSDDAAAKLRTMADGVIELSVVRTRGKVHRLLSVVKMERRRISSGSIPFEIDRSRGLVFRVSRFSLWKKQVASFLKMHYSLGNGGQTEKRPQGVSNKDSPTRQRPSSSA
jgi:KaiC/GvpD/RAD55 family RecA-like ATPase